MKLIDTITCTDMGDSLIITVRGSSENNSVKMIKIGDTGKDIIQEIQQGFSESEIITHLKEQYSVPAETIEKDVKTFICDLKQSGLIEL